MAEQAGFVSGGPCAPAAEAIHQAVARGVPEHECVIDLVVDRLLDALARGDVERATPSPRSIAEESEPEIVRVCWRDARTTPV